MNYIEYHSFTTYDSVVGLIFFQVLIVGGGDGGVIREVSKHSAVESIVQCEIDQVGVYG